MWIKCDNVPRLMREGLEINEAHLLREEGFIDAQRGRPEQAANPTWHLTRHMYLQDLQRPPLWIAKLEAHSDCINKLRSIRLDDLSFRNVHSAFAWGLAGEAIYQYKRWNLDEAFNVIYDDMPMKGWWPWPRKEPPHDEYQPPPQPLGQKHVIWRLGS
ncbi:hypothetical protein BKA67DRAFT_663606 [Truncatella angustata]|uniref:Uncharacterized protein n=1 Tax=Truncatella angustata TaxID=152316 RepID=A0A9P8UD75_9PEZI|nr:uncharacterized protein BKA67DRAFT_663606 [Truncatella angustata]KAH6647270.1 hypothetical protein BKA67DRAFT_663606 [Truncatella angustata]